jgi:hypothetical protein
MSTKPDLAARDDRDFISKAASTITLKLGGRPSLQVHEWVSNVIRTELAASPELRAIEEALQVTRDRLERLSASAYGEKGPPELVWNILAQGKAALAQLRALRGEGK